VNTILENVEEILDGTDLDVIDMPVYDVPDYLPAVVEAGNGTAGGAC
jgi:hypothetical protein